MTHEEKMAELDRRWNELAYGPLPPPRPKPVNVVVVPLRAEDAAVAKANPESVRVSARREDGATQMMKPLAAGHVRVLVEQVREVDAEGRPVWPKSGAVHEYNPLDALKGSGE
jgi:hypothetical protein